MAKKKTLAKSGAEPAGPLKKRAPLSIEARVRRALSAQARPAAAMAALNEPERAALAELCDEEGHYADNLREKFAAVWGAHTERLQAEKATAEA